MDAFGRSVQRLWCWREFSVPVGAVLGAYAAGWPDLALVGALVVVIAGVLLAAVRPRMIASAYRRCRVRSHILSTHIAWPGMCERLGWTRRLPSGTRLIPGLQSWAEDHQQVTIVVRPLAEQGRGSWDQMADALRRMVGGETVHWRESRGNLAVVVSRHGLPAKLGWTPGCCDIERIVLGQRHAGTPLALEVRRTPHLLLAGATGSGKGGAIRTAVAGALEAGWQAVVLDPKESGEYRWLDRLAIPVLSTLGEQVCMLEALDAIRQRRQELIKQYGIDTWRELPEPARVDWAPILLVVDEAADLLVPVKGKGEPQREVAALKHEAATLIAQLTRKGRSAGIHLIVAIQRPDTAQLGDGGGALRNNLTARLALGNLDAEGIRMLGVSTSDPVVATLDGTPGRGICVGFGDDPRPGACQVSWLEQRHAIVNVRSAAPQGLASMHPLRADHEEQSAKQGDQP
jgi:hypothetical protein